MITVSVLGLAALGLLVYLGGFVTGAHSTAKAHHRELQWLIREQRITASQVRHLNHLLNVPITDPDEEPRPAPSWPVRARAWAAAAWQRLTPTPLEQPNADSEPEADVVDEEEPEPDTDQMPATPGPATVPDLKQASQVPPPALLTDDEWAATRDRMLAEFHAEMAKIAQTEGAKP